MDGSRVSDFSIERILSPQLGPHRPPQGTRLPPDTRLQGLPAGFSLDPVRPPPGPAPFPGWIGFGEALYPFGPGFHHADFYSNSGVCVRLSAPADAQQLPGYCGYHQADVTAQAQLRQKSRMRTVFTDSQTKQLEGLFALTDYPPAEARAQVASSTGLSEETVRVWFKNRRARRKRQRGGSKVRSASPPHAAAAAAAESKLYASFL